MNRIILTIVAVLACGNALAAQYIGAWEHGSDSVRIRFALWDEDTPATCPSTDITNATSGLTIGFAADNEASATTYTGAKILSIATPGTYSAPTNSDEIRFGVVDAGSCIYEVQVRNERMEVASARQFYLEVSDGGQEIMDALYWGDLTPVSLGTLLAADCSGYTGANTLGYQLCTVLNAVLTDTDTSLPAAINAASAGSTRPRARLAP